MDNLIQILNNFNTINQQEIVDKQLMLQYINSFWEKSLYRECLAAHFTVSAFIVNKEKTHVLMAFHNIYKSFSWLGGHLDGENDYLKKAIEEATEESGIKNLKLIQNEIISLESLPVKSHIKKNKLVPHHLHLNITYAFEAYMTEELTIRIDENSDVKWIPINLLDDFVLEKEMIIIYKKILERLN